MKDMLGALIRKIVDLPIEMGGALYDLVEKLASEAGQQWLAELKKFLRKEICWSSGEQEQKARTLLDALEATNPAPAELLLDPVGTVNIMATTEKFVASEKFILDTGPKANVKTSYIGDNFTKWFLGEDGKAEAPIGEQALCYACLKNASVDAPIISEIGGEAKVETTLTEMFSLMKKQKNGEAGVLLNGGYANIFYVKDKKGVLRAVYVRWYGGGWGVLAYSVDDTLGWGDDGQVFFRIPVVA